MASSEFLTNKEQGDWAEDIVFKAINEFSEEYVGSTIWSLRGFVCWRQRIFRLFENYQEELNTIGKRPDLLIFRRTDTESGLKLKDCKFISQAVAAIEIRSSAFLIEKYNEFMESRYRKSISNCVKIKSKIMGDSYRELLKNKSLPIYNLVRNADEDSFRDLTFRTPSWRSTKELSSLCDLLKELKKNITILHKRDYLALLPRLKILHL